jgi:hypothetical protein
MSSLLAAAASVGELEFLMMGGETARNMWSIDSNKEYCVTLQHVGYT